MSSSIIVRYVWQILGRGCLFAHPPPPHPWAGPKMPNLDRIKLNALYTLHSCTNSLKWPLIDYALYFQALPWIDDTVVQGSYLKNEKITNTTPPCFTLFQLGWPLDLNFGTFMKNFLVTPKKVFLIYFFVFWTFTVGYQKVCRCKIFIIIKAHG